MSVSLFPATLVLVIFLCYASSLRMTVPRTISRPLSATATVGSANLDWPSLGFEYSSTESFVKCEYKNGEWGEVQLEADPYVRIHIGATALHYGQACFEGMKAFHTKDGKVCIFRPDENFARISRSSERVCMPPLPEKKFIDAMKLVVKENLAYVPVSSCNYYHVL
jgi:branched-chain amino acid aminotransferase